MQSKRHRGKNITCHAGLDRSASSGVHTACFRQHEVVGGLVASIRASLEVEAQHGAVKIYSAEERAAFAADRGLACV